MDPAKFHLIAGRRNGKSLLSTQLTRALMRAEVYHYVDHKDGVWHFVSQNQLEPLTDEEKELLLATIGVQNVPYEIVFDN